MTIPPRPAPVWSRARTFDRCRTCDLLVWPFQRVGRWGGQWQHAFCVRLQLDLVDELEGGSAWRRTD